MPPGSVDLNRWGGDASADAADEVEDGAGAPSLVAPALFCILAMAGLEAGCCASIGGGLDREGVAAGFAVPFRTGAAPGSLKGLTMPSASLALSAIG